MEATKKFKVGSSSSRQAITNNTNRVQQRYSQSIYLPVQVRRHIHHLGPGSKRKLHENLNLPFHANTKRWQTKAPAFQLCSI